MEGKTEDSKSKPGPAAAEQALSNLNDYVSSIHLM